MDNFTDGMDTALAEASVASREVADVLEMARQNRTELDVAELVKFANAIHEFNVYVQGLLHDS